MSAELNAALGALAITAGGPDENGRRDWHWRGRYMGTYTEKEGRKALDEMLESYLPQ